jgi:hypothetical protein
MGMGAGGGIEDPLTQFWLLPMFDFLLKKFLTTNFKLYFRNYFTISNKREGVNSSNWDASKISSKSQKIYVTYKTKKSIFIGFLVDLT